VKIRFRGDALGAGDRPIDPDTGETVDGVSTFFVGKLVAVSASGVVIERYMIISKTKKEHWVPREVILFIQVDP
ncbi:MAG: hypothetical protein VB835_05725, partial [Pirellulales bacterium]